MDLIHDATFRIVGQTSDYGQDYEPGIYRVILPLIQLNKTAVVRIHSDNADRRGHGGRKKKATMLRKLKKPSLPLVGTLLWHDNEVLDELESKRLAAPIEIKTQFGHNSEPTSGRAKSLFDIRLDVASGFLDLPKLKEEILIHQGIGGLAKEAMARTNCSRALVYKVWSALCRHGFKERNLRPRFDQCGAPAVARPCAPGMRKKAGRKTTEQRIAKAYGIDLDPTQPGVSTEWAAAIRSADKTIPDPKPSWPKRCTRILESAFCSKAQERDGKIVLVKPEMGSYPNDKQIKRVLIEGQRNFFSVKVSGQVLWDDGFSPSCSDRFFRSSILRRTRSARLRPDASRNSSEERSTPHGFGV